MGKLKMTTTRNYILTILTFLCSLTLFAENKLAIIKDPDGFTYVRNGQGKGFKVIDTLFTDDFFYFQPVDSSDWVKVTAWKGRQLAGFVHISRVQEVEKLDLKKQKELITKTLDKHRILAYAFQNAWKSKDSLAYRTTVRELEFHSDTKYDPILVILPKYFCSTSDTNVLQLFFSTMWADKGSANEMPSFSIGDCFICNPDLVIEQLAKIKRSEQKKSIFDHIEWGLVNHFGVEEGSKSDNKEFSKLKTRLDSERKKASP
ncbi:MAG: hypothetical protein JST48_05700 [Bacteroidetes bacterium]|nr:hypothetical protein [Bacteroidota bacterium]